LDGRKVSPGSARYAPLKPTVRWGHPVHRQWLVLLGLLSVVTIGLVYGDWLWRADGALYDTLIPTRTVPADIVIVAVDDMSVTQLGRWPWPRTLHAELLRQLREQQVKAVALDFIFSESETPASDTALAEAMRAGPPTVLPVLAAQREATAELTEYRPITALAAAAAGLGHVHLEIDRDGIARSVFLREGLKSPHLSHLALALLEAVPGVAPQELPGTRASKPTAERGVWRRDYQILIPFLGPPGTVRTISYVDLLQGKVPKGTLTGTYVLVGATAQGLGDAYSTARPGVGRAMAGVEITANIVDTLLRKQAVREVSTPFRVVWSLLVLLLVFVGFLRLSASASLSLVVAAIAVTLLISAMLLGVAKIWLPPAAAVLTLIAAYPLWAWRRLQAAQSFLDEELRLSIAEPLPLAASQLVVTQRQVAVDPLQRRIDMVRESSLRLKNMRSLLADTILSMPDATLVVDLNQVVMLANPVAAKLLGANGVQPLLQQQLSTVLPRGIRIAANNLYAAPPQVLEASSVDDRDLFIRTAAFSDAKGERVGTIIIIADVTESRRAQREREEVLQFLSHDIRHPATSLLALTKLDRDPLRAATHADFVQRVEVLSQRTLDLAEGFVALARAESVQPAQFQSEDLRDAIQDAVDENWLAAQLRSVKIDVTHPAEIMWVQGNRQLLSRAISNLISNAVKNSPVGATVFLAIRAAAAQWQIDVSDAGPGIPTEQIAKLFQPFQRIRVQGHTDPGGIGLGLAFVRVVATRHGGSAKVANNQDLNHAVSGACFSLFLPRGSAP
jgi:CHASE2 domain-containing sensor protein/signal transduction histidine kinase